MRMHRARPSQRTAASRNRRPRAAGTHVQAGTPSQSAATSAAGSEANWRPQASGADARGRTCRGCRTSGPARRFARGQATLEATCSLGPAGGGWALAKPSITGSDQPARCAELKHAGTLSPTTTSCPSQPSTNFVPASTGPGFRSERGSGETMRSAATFPMDVTRIGVPHRLSHVIARSSRSNIPRLSTHSGSRRPPAPPETIACAAGRPADAGRLQRCGPVIVRSGSTIRVRRRTQAQRQGLTRWSRTRER